MSSEPVSLDLDRRSFMKASALTGAVALGGGVTGQALAQDGDDGEVDATDDNTDLTKTICNFCAVGCGFHGEREGNAFVGQEPWDENPINNGSLCSKGAAIYGSEHSPKRLKHPMKMENGEWQKVTWDQAYSQISDEIERVWEEHSRESVMLLGSAHHCNEEAYAIRKLASFMGTNNIDHQARICHSTTVAGLANTWGFGAMTNTINDYRNFDVNLIIGQNPAEAHPIAMQHILEGQARGGDIISVDARFTKTSAHADDFHRIRPGTDVALMMGIIKYMRDQDALYEQFIEDRMQGWEDVEAELDQYDLETVADITWISEEEIQSIGDALIEAQPNVQIEWAMGGTQHNNGTQNIRSYALTAAATGGLGRAGGGLQVMRGHSNVQGATDLAVASHILPGYYGVGSVGSWDYWSKVWNQTPYTSGSLSFDELYGRFDEMPMDKYVEGSNAESPEDVGTAGTVNGTEVSERSMMLQKGLTVARWYEAALPEEDRLHQTPIYQPDQVKVAFYWGHSVNSITEINKQKEAMEDLDLLVVVDLFPSLASVLPDFDDAPPILLLPAASQYEHYRSLTNSHRAVQWSQPVRPPSHNTKPDMQIMQELADSLGFGEHFDWGSGTGLYNGKSTHEEVVREINLGVTSIGYRQDPERLQQHLEYDYAFSTEDTRANLPGSPVDGEWWMLPWPCWGEGHPGTPIIWRDTFDPREGGMDIAADWGTQAPTPQEWEQMNTETGEDQPYPLQNTYEQAGEEGLNMIRADYDPDWQTDWDDTIRGVPRYPGLSFALPDDPSNSDALTVPMEYALDPTQSVYDAAQAVNEEYDWADVDVEQFEPYDFAQPDPPTGRGRGRGVAWNFIDTVPVHREPIESPRPDLVEEWPANGQQKNFFRLDQNNAVTQEESTRLANENGFGTVMTTGRQVEHQGGGSESRSNIFLADLQPHMYAEVHPQLAEQKGIDGGELVIVQTTDRGSGLMRARVTYRPRENEIFLPFHWAGIHEGESLEDKYPDGHLPFAIGESANTLTVRGYDAETQMQETKPALVKIDPATQDLANQLNMNVDLSQFEFPQDGDNLGIQKEFDVRDHHTVQ